MPWVVHLACMLQLLASSTAKQSPLTPGTYPGLMRMELPPINLSDVNVTQGWPPSGVSLSEGIMPNLVLHIYNTSSPNLHTGGGLALLAIVVMVLADFVGHVAERWVINQHQQGLVDWFIHGCITFLSLSITAAWFGTFQEYILTTSYHTGKFPSVMFLIFAHRLMTVMLSLWLLYVNGEPLDLRPLKLASVPGAISSVGTFLGDYALNYVSFPVVAVFKSSAIIPTMAINHFVNGEKRGWKEYANALFITVCIAGFTIAHGKLSIGTSSWSATGVGILTCCVLIGSLTSTLQRKIFDSHRGFSILQMMLASSMCSACVSGLSAFGSVGFFPVLLFMKQNPICMLHIFLLGLSSTMCTYVVFYIMKHQGPVALTIMFVAFHVISNAFLANLYGPALGSWAQVFACGVFSGVIISTAWAIVAQQDPSHKMQIGHLCTFSKATGRFKRRWSDMHMHVRSQGADPYHAMKTMTMRK